jgi:hypothetical protein
MEEQHVAYFYQVQDCHKRVEDIKFHSVNKMMGSVQIIWQCLVVRTEKILAVWPCSQSTNLHFTKKIVLPIYSNKLQGGALCLTTKAWSLQSVLKQGFVVGVYVTLPPKQTTMQSLATMASPQITTAEIRNLRHGTAELAGIFSLEVGIIFHQTSWNYLPCHKPRS